MNKNVSGLVIVQRTGKFVTLLTETYVYCIFKPCIVCHSLSAELKWECYMHIHIDVRGGM